jgi:hypothetical protein
MSAKGKCIYPNLRQPPKNKSLLRKNILLLIIYLIHKARQILSTFTVDLKVVRSLEMFQGGNQELYQHHRDQQVLT